MSEDEIIPTSEDEPITDVAAEIILWQSAAQKLPLAEVQDMASMSLDCLAQILNEFNHMCRDGQPSDDALADAVLEVARQATAAAIFTLGASQRTWQEAALK
jgi:hypothetical protein